MTEGNGTRADPALGGLVLRTHHVHVLAPQLERPRLPARRVRRPAGDRHLQLVERAHDLQRAPADRGRARQARRLGGRRPAARVPDDVARRDDDEADDDALAQPHGDGRRGVAAREPARRRRAPVRLRQDHAGAADGRRERRPADDLHARRPDAERPVARGGGRLGHRSLAHLPTCVAGASSPTRSTSRSRPATRAPTATATRWARPAR